MKTSLTHKNKRLSYGGCWHFYIVILCFFGGWMSRNSMVLNELVGVDAIELWKKGKDEWNRWSAQNPSFRVIFDNVDFTKYTSENNSYISFEGYIFPENGDVSFNYAYFGGGGVSFRKAIFGGDIASFNFAIFGKGRANFSDAVFKSKKVSFFCAEIEGISIFENVSFYCEVAFFRMAKFGGHADFSNLKFSTTIRSLTFGFAYFASSFELSSVDCIPCVPDLTGTKTSNHVNLSGLKYKLNGSGKGPFKKVTNAADSDYLCRLKEITESNKDHSMALKLHSDEMRAKRWHRYNKSASCLDYIFDVTSNYGQSIFRPFLCWFLLFMFLEIYTVGYSMPAYGWLLGGILVCIYLNLNTSMSIISIGACSLILASVYFFFFKDDFWYWVGNTKDINYNTFLSGVKLSLSKSLPFISGASDLGREAQESFRCKDMDDSCEKVILSEEYGVVSALFFTLPSLGFIFLIGLGLRNRFRL